MGLMLLLETAILLAGAQLLLGALGYVTKSLPWLGLPLPFLFVWLIVRTAVVLREEMTRAQRKGLPLVPHATALFVTVLWQVPALLCLLAPPWGLGLWQGAALPVTTLLSRSIAPNLAQAPLLWAALLLQMGLFILMAGRIPVLKRVQPQAGPTAGRPNMVAAEWAPARRLKDVERRRKPQVEAQAE